MEQFPLFRHTGSDREWNNRPARWTVTPHTKRNKTDENGTVEQAASATNHIWKRSRGVPFQDPPRSRRAPRQLSPRRVVLYPAPCTPHPVPRTLYPAPCTPHPAPAPCTRTLHPHPAPAPCTPHPAHPTPTCRIPRPAVATPQIRIRQFATVCDRVIFREPNTTIAKEDLHQWKKAHSRNRTTCPRSSSPSCRTSSWPHRLVALGVIDTLP